MLLLSSEEGADAVAGVAGAGAEAAAGCVRRGCFGTLAAGGVPLLLRREPTDLT